MSKAKNGMMKRGRLFGRVSVLYNSAYCRVLFFLAIGLAAIATVGADEGKMVPVMKPFVDRGEIPGIVSIIGSADRIIDFSVVGYANCEEKTPLKKDSVFWIASMSKVVTTAAFMTLVDEGKVKLDDPITKYFPELDALRVVEEKKSDGTLVLRRPKTVPTFRQAMSHTAGFEFITPYMAKYGIDSLPAERMVMTLGMTPMPMDPMTKYKYSNAGIDVAGALVERLTGKSQEEYLRERFFEPLGMKDTTYYPDESLLKRLATAYFQDKGKKKISPKNVYCLTYPLSDRHIRFPEGGGGLFSTAEDVYKFFRMLALEGTVDGKTLLSKNAVAEMTKNQTGTLGSYGFGLQVDPKGQTFSHGGAYGTQALVYRPGKGIAVYMIQNAGLPNAGKAYNAFTKAALALYAETPEQKSK